MKRILTALFLASALVLPAQEAPQNAPILQTQKGECWEIVTDIYIGVQTEQLTPEDREAYGDKSGLLTACADKGLRIKRVLAGSPAEKAGLEEGDIIMSNNACGIGSMEDLLMSVRNTRPGDTVHFSILREGVWMELPLRVESLPKPVVVARARLLENKATPDCETCGEDADLQDQGLSPQAAMAAKQGRIARSLGAETPDLQAIRHEFAGINTLFPSHGRPGQVRLYYETDSGYATVTCYPAGITVTIQSGKEMQAYHLKQQGDTLPEPLRKTFSEL